MYGSGIRESWIEGFWLRITHEVAGMTTTRVIIFIFWPSDNLKAWPLRGWKSASKMVCMTVGWRPQFVMMWNSALGCLNVLKTWQLLSLEKNDQEEEPVPFFALPHCHFQCISFIRSKSLSPAHMETRLHFMEARVSKNCENISRSLQWVYQSGFSRETEPTGHLSI